MSSAALLDMLFHLLQAVVQGMRAFPVPNGLKQQSAKRVFVSQFEIHGTRFGHLRGRHGEGESS